MRRDKAIAKLLAVLPELLRDYERVAYDESERGGLASERKKLIRRVNGLIFDINCGQFVTPSKKADA